MTPSLAAPAHGQLAKQSQPASGEPDGVWFLLCSGDWWRRPPLLLKRTSWPISKDGIENFRDPASQGQGTGFGIGNVSKFEQFDVIRSWKTVAVQHGLEHRHHVGCSVTVSILDDEIRPAKRADEAS